MIFILDPREHLVAELLDCFGAIERKAGVHLAAAEMAGHALRLKYWFDLSLEVHLV